MKLQRAAERRSPSVSAWTREAKSSIPSIVWSLRKRGMPSVSQKTAQLVRTLAHLARQVRLLLTQMRGHRIPGEHGNNGVGSGGLDNSGAKNGENGDHRNRPGAAGASLTAPTPSSRRILLVQAAR